jgi:hypothetical protein
LVTAAARARESGGAICLLLDGTVAPLSLDGVPVVTARGVQRLWLAAVWRTALATREPAGVVARCGGVDRIRMAP